MGSVITYLLIFLLSTILSHTVLAEPRRQFEIVFRMIDVDGSDTVDINEFTKVCTDP